MEILTKPELHSRYEEIVKRIKGGALFIHPTDTIYGIGCNALNKRSVNKIRELKERPDSPLSIWVPSINWIKENCELTKKLERWISQLPGPYTLITSLKNKLAIADNVAPNVNTIGIRYPDHWFNQIVRSCGVPIVTTSANITSEPFMTSLEDLNPEIEKNVDLIIYEGKKEARPSKIIHVENEEIKER